METVSNPIRKSETNGDRDSDLKAKRNNWLEILDDEEIKKIDAYIEWEQEYYIINQSYLLEDNSRA